MKVGGVAVMLGVALAACARDEIRADSVTTAYAEETIATREAPRASVLVEPSPLRLAEPVTTLGAERGCRIGTRISCLPRLRLAEDDSPDVGAHGGPYSYCVRGADGIGHYSRSSCNTPLAFAAGTSAVTFTHVAADFHIGSADRTEWISAATPWLALDRDGNGTIDSERELFAGFHALAALDTNRDGVIDRRDPAFGELLLWSDANQDKASTADELIPLCNSGIANIPLGASTATPQLGSYEGEMVAVEGGRIVDVHLAAER